MTKRVLPENEIIEKYKNGSTSWSLGKEYACDHYTIIRLLRRNGVAVRVWGSNAKRFPTENSIPSSDRIRALAKAQGLDITTCEVCGITGITMHVHHGDFNHRNNRAENLLVLCPKCHKGLHTANYYHQ